MRVTWEGKDIRAGRVVQKPDVGVTGRYVIGWVPTTELAPREGIEFVSNCYAMISLADGMIMLAPGQGTPGDLAKQLNDAGYYMPAELEGVSDIYRKEESRGT